MNSCPAADYCHRDTRYWARVLQAAIQTGTDTDGILVGYAARRIPSAARLV